jgi:STE24 endopeptidase
MDIGDDRDAHGATVLLVRAPSRRAVLGPALLAGASAEIGARLLTPRERLPDPVAVDLNGYFTRAEIERGARYARPQLALGLARSALQAGVLVAAHRRLRRRAAPPRGARREALAGAATAAGLALGTTAAGLPIAAASRRRALSVGLATQTWRGWGADLVKAGAIEVAMTGALGAGLAELTRRYPRDWWLPAAGGSIALGTALGALAPVILDPLFNDFTPLPEGTLRGDVMALAAQAGVRVGQVFSVDASRRMSAANAYVTGLGPTKRVVLFDTLLDRYDRDEVRSVVAHELAHVAHRDVLRGVAFGAFVAVPAALATQRLSWVLSPARSGAAILPALALAGGLVSAPTSLIANRLSRAIERRADATAIALAGATEAFIAFERAIALQNVADLDPPGWVTKLLSTHPSTAQRIGAALAATPEGRRPTPAGS